MFSGHLEFLKQRKIGKRNKLLLSGWVRGRKDEREGMGKEIFFSFLLFPFSFQHPSNIVTQYTATYIDMLHRSKLYSAIRCLHCRLIQNFPSKGNIFFRIFYRSYKPHNQNGEKNVE